MVLPILIVTPNLVQCEDRLPFENAIEVEEETSWLIPCSPNKGCNLFEKSFTLLCSGLKERNKYNLIVHVFTCSAWEMGSALVVFWPQADRALTT
jgi:hypothetical protein